MATVPESVIRDMTDAIVQEVQPQQVILFGSRARGDSREHSDADFLVVANESFDPERDRFEEMTRLLRLLARFPLDADVLVYSHAEVQDRRTSRNHVIGRALREGRVLYERA